MPCIIITGHPGAGKTTVAQLLRDRARKHHAIDEVILINEESECSNNNNNNNNNNDDDANGCIKQSCYETPSAEKKTRGTLKSAFDRAVGVSMPPSQRKRRLIILDSLNYIKGFGMNYIAFPRRQEKRMECCGYSTNQMSLENGIPRDNNYWEPKADTPPIYWRSLFCDTNRPMNEIDGTAHYSLWIWHLLVAILVKQQIIKENPRNNDRNLAPTEIPMPTYFIPRTWPPNRKFYSNRCTICTV